jgi:UDP-N-acetylmuramoyl-tripeptide--D-alanyl-D-alanine ligase
MKITGEMLKQIADIEHVPDLCASGVSIDSRSTNPGDLFFAIRGKNFNGNDFAGEAIAKGAVAAVVDDANLIGEKFIVVDDAIDALKNLGAYIKDLVRPKLTFGITGSVGKTTTKLWLHDILGRSRKSYVSPGNYNTIYGIPISLTSLEPGTDYCIMEIGSSRRGEILELSEYLTPDIAIITNIYESHIGNFKDFSELAKEKMSIIDGIGYGGSLVYDGSSPYREDIEKLARDKKILDLSVGFERSCDFYILESNKNVVKLKVPHETFEYCIGEGGRHYAYMSACVIALIYAAGFPIRDILPYFKKLKASRGRGERITCCCNGKTFELIDGSYNASPTSVLASLEQLANSPSQRKIAILGQMLELGPHEDHYHDMIANAAKTCELESLIFIGEEKLWRFFKDCEKSRFYPEMTDIVANEILDSIPDKATVLVKGSRSIRLDILVNNASMYNANL